jgi:hypothetical protein
MNNEQKLEILKNLDYSELIFELIEDKPEAVYKDDELTLSYFTIKSNSYFENLSELSSRVNRSIEQIITYLQNNTKIKLMSIQYKTETYYGMKLDSRDKVKLQNVFNEYIKLIKCRNCFSRFTKVENMNTICTSCGYIDTKVI